MILNIPNKHQRIFKIGDRSAAVISIKGLAKANRGVFPAHRSGYDFEKLGLRRLSIDGGAHKTWIPVEDVIRVFSELPDDFTMSEYIHNGTSSRRKKKSGKGITENGTSAILSELIEIKDLLKRIAAAWEV